MKVLLAIDNSEFGRAALRMVAAQMDPSKQQVRLLTVLEPIIPLAYTETPLVYGPRMDAMIRDRAKSAESFLRGAAKSLRARGFKVSSSVQEGDIRQEILRVAKTWNAKLIVLGSHSRKGMSRVVLGSVSEFVARHAACSVQIVRK
jgi:nucleotide-binding universal stress UspA family protein